MSFSTILDNYGLSSKTYYYICIVNKSLFKLYLLLQVDRTLENKLIKDTKPLFHK